MTAENVKPLASQVLARKNTSEINYHPDPVTRHSSVETKSRPLSICQEASNSRNQSISHLDIHLLPGPAIAAFIHSWTRPAPTKRSERYERTSNDVEFMLEGRINFRETAATNNAWERISHTSSILFRSLNNYKETLSANYISIEQEQADLWSSILYRQTIKYLNQSFIAMRANDSIKCEATRVSSPQSRHASYVRRAKESALVNRKNRPIQEIN